MNNSLERRITLGSVLKFTLPSMVTMVVMSLYTVVDGTFVSRLIGTDAFSAVNIVYPLLSLAVGVGTMFGTGLAAIVSLKLGQDRRQEARRNFTFVALCAAAAGVVLTLVCSLFLKDILYLLGANEEIYAYCYAYAAPLLPFLAPSILQLVFQILYGADGRPAIGLVVTILGGLTNVALDYLFIAVLDMGIAGAAWGTGLGYSVPTLFGLVYFACPHKGNLRFAAPKPDWKVLGHTASNGSSEMVSALSTSVTTLLFNLIMMRFCGQNGVAAISILLYLDFVLIAISLGYSMGAAPLVSYNYGRGDHDKLKKLYRLSVGVCTGVGVVMTIGTLLFAPQLTAIFAPRGSAVYTLAVGGLRIYALSYLFKGYSVLASALFTAFGNGKVSALLSCMRTLVLLVAALLGLSALFGIAGVWWASPVAEALACGISLFFVLRWKKIYHFG